MSLAEAKKEWQNPEVKSFNTKTEVSKWIDSVAASILIELEAKSTDHTEQCMREQKILLSKEWILWLTRTAIESYIDCLTIKNELFIDTLRTICLVRMAIEWNLTREKNNVTMETTKRPFPMREIWLWWFEQDGKAA